MYRVDSRNRQEEEAGDIGMRIGIPQVVLDEIDVVEYERRGREGREGDGDGHVMVERSVNSSRHPIGTATGDL